MISLNTVYVMNFNGLCTQLTLFITIKTRQFLYVEAIYKYRKLLEECVCLYCSDQVIEDEYHFLCCCTPYNSETNSFYRKIKTVYPDFDFWNLNRKFIVIMSFDTNRLATFVEKI